MTLKTCTICYHHFGDYRNHCPICGAAEIGSGKCLDYGAETLVELVRAWMSNFGFQITAR